MALGLISTVLPAPALTTGDFSGTLPAPTSFPFGYVPPSIPSFVGPQGVVGPNVPMTAIGAGGEFSGAGVYGKLGPVNGSGTVAQNDVATTLEVVVRYGSASLNSAAASVLVSLENLTTAQYVNGTTNGAGYVNLTTTEGWWFLSISSTSGSYVSFLQPIELVSPTTLVTRYLLGSGPTSTSVRNGPGADDSLSYSLQVVTNYDPFGFAPQFEVQLLNRSSGDGVLVTGYTASNGTVSFSSLDSNFVYAASLVPTNTFTGVATGDLAQTTNLTGEGAITLVDEAETTSSGTLTGSPLPASGYSWSVTHPTTITGGVTYLSAVPSLGAHLTFVNALLFVNSTYDSVGGLVSGTFTAINTTIVYLYPSDFLNSSTDASTYAHDIVIGTLVAGARDGRGVRSLLQLGTATFSEFMDTNTTTPAPAIYGNYTDDLLEDVTYGAGWATFTRCSLLNVTLVPAGYGSKASLAHTALSNSTLLYGNEALRVSNVSAEYSNLYDSGNATEAVSDSWLNLSITSASLWLGKSLAFGTASSVESSARLLHDYVSVVQQPSLNFTDAVEFQSRSFGGSNNAYTFSLANTTNMTQVVLNLTTFPRVNLTILGGTLNAYDVVLHLNYTPAQVLAGGTGSATDPVKVGSAEFWVWDGDWDYSLLDAGTFWVLAATGNFEVAHDLFPWTTQDFAFSDTQFFPHGHTPNDAITFLDDRWQDIYWNETVIDWVHAYSQAGIGSAAIQDLGGGNPEGTPVQEDTGPGWLNVTHCAFGGRPLGVVGESSTWLLLGQEFVRSNVSDSVFENSPSDTFGQSTYAPTYDYDSVTGGQQNVYFDDWFLNLTNITVPVGSNDGIAGGQGFGSYGGITLSGDVFYYAPEAFGATFVPAGGPTLNAQNLTGSPDCADSLCAYGGVHYPTESTVTYEVPVGYNSSLTFGGTGELVSNLSNLQSMPSPYRSYEPGWPSECWSWSITPDVTVSHGVPTVSPAGGELGPQPPFEWEGYRYSEQVEESYVQVGANSTRAPTIDVELYAGAPGSVFRLYGYDENALGSPAFLNTTVTSGAMGYVAFAYTPSSEPLNSTFALEFISGPPGKAGTSDWLEESIAGVPVCAFLAGSAVVAVVVAGLGLGLRKKAGRK